MKFPKRFKPLLEDGLVDEVISQLMSGKEATVYMVRCGDNICCAKVYKEASKRSFKKAALYQEGRKVRNTRRARAMQKSSKFGRKQQEEIWHSAEVDALYLLAAAGVRVPEPYGCYDGILLMELVTDAEGYVAPRLNDVELSKEVALEDHQIMMNAIKVMLCNGVVHGDLSEFNVLLDEQGPVIIDLPQAVNASTNNNAESMFQRDVNNITTYYAQFAPELAQTHYAKEMWHLFENGELTPETELTGIFIENAETADVDVVLQEIKEAFKEEQQRLERIKNSEENP